MNTKISETRLKDSLQSLQNLLEDQVKKKSDEQQLNLDLLEKKHLNKMNDFEDEMQIEIGKIQFNI